MKLKISLLLAALITSIFSEVFSQRQFFDKNKDFLLANFDLRPDEDDVHAAAALASMLKHPDLNGVDFHAVAGAYGIQGNKYITAATPGLYNNLFGPKNNKWSDAHNERNASLNRVKNKIVSVLNAGNQVFVQEAGQSDFTHDVLKAVISQNNGVNAAKVKNNVIVVQHSQWNENKTTQWKLNWVRNNTDYRKIADGNSGGNGTPQYKNNNSSWMNRAKANNNPNTSSRNFWRQADNVCDNFQAGWENPTIAGGGVDYSDTVEIWWIFNIGNNANTIQKFWNRYIVNTPSGGGNDNPPPGGGTPDVNCTTLPASVASNAALAVSVNYTSDQNRDVVIELWRNNQYLKEGRTAVTAGSGTANVTINLNSAPAAGTNYLLKASIRPTGTNWRQNLDACNRTNITITNGGGGNDNPPPGNTPDVNCNTLPGTLTSGTSIPVSINYTSDQNRDVVFELWRGSQYLTQKKTTVGAGSGVANVTLNLNSPPPAGGNYLLKSSIRPVGADWRQSLDACNRNNVTVSANFANRSSNSALEKVKIYPNILRGNTLNIEVSDTENNSKMAVFIYNSRGKLMQEMRPAFRAKSKIQLKVNPLIDNRVYFVKVSNGKHKKVKRIVVKR